MLKKFLSLLIISGVALSGLGLNAESIAAPHDRGAKNAHHKVVKHKPPKPEKKSVKKKHPHKIFNFFKKKSDKPQVKNHLN